MKRSATIKPVVDRPQQPFKFIARSFAGLLAFLAFVDASFASPIAVSSALDLRATSGFGSFQVIDAVNSSQGASIGNLGILNASAVSNSAGGTSITSGSASASWTDTAAGQVRFEQIGWDNSAFTPTVVSQSSLQGTQWAYTFVADVSGLFSVNWDVFLHQPVSDSFGLIDFRFSMSGTAGGQTIMGVNSVGSTTRNIFAGNQYTALIQTNAGITGGVGGRTSFMTGIFDWSMDSGAPSSVPEPGMLSLLGLGLLGLVSRRKKPA